MRVFKMSNKQLVENTLKAKLKLAIPYMKGLLTLNMSEKNVIKALKTSLSVKKRLKLNKESKQKPKLNPLLEQKEQSLFEGINPNWHELSEIKKFHILKAKFGLKETLKEWEQEIPNICKGVKALKGMDSETKLKLKELIA